MCNGVENCNCISENPFHSWQRKNENHRMEQQRWRRRRRRHQQRWKKMSFEMLNIALRNDNITFQKILSETKWKPTQEFLHFCANLSLQLMFSHTLCATVFYSCLSYLMVWLLLMFIFLLVVAATAAAVTVCPSLSFSLSLSLCLCHVTSNPFQFFFDRIAFLDIHFEMGKKIYF